MGVTYNLYNVISKYKLNVWTPQISTTLNPGAFEHQQDNTGLDLMGWVIVNTWNYLQVICISCIWSNDESYLQNYVKYTRYVTRSMYIFQNPKISEMFLILRISEVDPQPELQSIYEELHVGWGCKQWDNECINCLLTDTCGAHGTRGLPPAVLLTGCQLPGR